MRLSWAHVVQRRQRLRWRCWSRAGDRSRRPSLWVRRAEWERVTAALPAGILVCVAWIPHVVQASLVRSLAIAISIVPVAHGLIVGTDPMGVGGVKVEQRSRAKKAGIED
jgi:hypothetical protein